MKKSSFFKSLPFKLLVGVVIGILAGLALNANDGTGLTNAILNIIVTLKYVLGQIISFCVPLIIIGFIAPSITKMGNNASRLLLLAVCIAYVSSVGAALFSTAAGYTLIPHLSIVTDVDGLKELLEMVFELSIPQIMPVMSALVFSIMIGLAAAWNKAKLITGMLEEFQKIVLSIGLELTAKLYGRYTLYNIYFICQERKEEVTHDFTTINISCDCCRMWKYYRSSRTIIYFTAEFKQCYS